MEFDVLPSFMPKSSSEELFVNKLGGILLQDENFKLDLKFLGNTMGHLDVSM